jgi:hypothetical protein
VQNDDKNEKKRFLKTKNFLFDFNLINYSKFSLVGSTLSKEKTRRIWWSNWSRKYSLCKRKYGKLFFKISIGLCCTSWTTSYSSSSTWSNYEIKISGNLINNFLLSFYRDKIV